MVVVLATCHPIQHWATMKQNKKLYIIFHNAYFLKRSTFPKTHKLFPFPSSGYVEEHINKRKALRVYVKIKWSASTHASNVSHSWVNNV